MVYIHGRGGDVSEAEHYQRLFGGYDVLGLDYKAQCLSEALTEFPPYFNELRCRYEDIILIANSIGAYYSMYALDEGIVSRAFLISPIADMEGLITGMMNACGISEERLRDEGVISTPFGEKLRWDELCYVRTHLPKPFAPTGILCGERDELSSPEAMERLAERLNAGLTVMEGGEHWFHTPVQMAFLDRWIRAVP